MLINSHCIRDKDIPHPVHFVLNDLATDILGFQIGERVALIAGFWNEGRETIARLQHKEPKVAAKPSFLNTFKICQKVVPKAL